jgi:hypothetical protein
MVKNGTGAKDRGLGKAERTEKGVGKIRGKDGERGAYRER